MFLSDVRVLDLPRSKSMLRVVLLAVVAVVDADISLRDHPIASGTAPVYLDGNAWTASTLPPPHADEPRPKIAITVPATVPGDLITDLQRANIIADPFL